MAVIYANGNAGYTSNNATGTSLSIAVTTGGSTDCYIAILVGQSSSSSFSGVTQTNVTWQFCGSWSYAAEGWVFECWVGWATGTPGALP